MRTLTAASLFAILFLAVSVTAQARKSGPDQPSPNTSVAALPLRRVVLYKNGIGYFEHSAKVNGSEELHIDFTTAQLNDALASLTAYDLGGGRITSVRFNSIAPLGERLRALRLPLGQQTTRQQFLDALRGTRVEIQSGGTQVAGKLLSVENVSRATGRERSMEYVLVVSIVTDAGGLRSFELGPGVTVQIADGELRDDVAHYLRLIGSERAGDVRRMTVTDDGSGERSVRVSYISEVPVWKSTYRILLPSDAGEKPMIQGWAIVDNTLGEDWNNVQLSLVSGSPQSFVENLSLPYYVRRPVEPLPQSVMLTPQTHEAALMPMKPANNPGYGGGIGTGAGSALGGGVPGGQMGGVLGGPIGGATGWQSGGASGGSGGGVFSVGGAPAAPSVIQSDVLARIEPQAAGRQLSELFEYDIKTPVTIGRNQSALVPILQARLEAEKVTLWNAGDSVPLRALWLTNSSGLALDAGTFEVVDDGTFAGEGLFDTVRTGEKRLVSYAADPAVQVSTKDSSPPEQITRVHVAKGLMITSRELRRTVAYRISDSDSRPRTVIIEHPVRDGWKLAKDLKPEETTPSYYRFKVSVKPETSSNLVVEENRPEVSRLSLSSLTSDEVQLLARQQRLTPEMEAAFQKILGQKNALAELDGQINARQQDISSLSDDQGRIRENMKALKGGVEEKQLLDRYVRELNAQEDRLTTLRSQLAGLNSKRNQAASELDRTIEGITFDETF